MCLHAVAISKCAVDVDGVHVMTTELRVAYEQVDDVWRCLPDEFRFDKDSSWWANEAKDGLATYNHPTMVGLVLWLAGGGFVEAEAPESYNAACLVAGPSRMRTRDCARLSGASAGHRRGRRFPFEGGSGWHVLMARFVRRVA